MTVKDEWEGGRKEIVVAYFRALSRFSSGDTTEIRCGE
jgi:hypothetical protein